MNTLFKTPSKSLKSVDYMIDLHYGQKDWDMSSALREIIANAIDTKKSYEYGYKDGVATISDQGPGLPKKAFVMGASSKASDATSIGQFGEGLKMCLVTALRYRKTVSIATNGYGVECESVHSNEYDSDIMRIHFTDRSIPQGTVIKVECEEEDYKKALEMFLQFRSGYKKLERNLYLPGGYLSILGLTTEERPNLMFSYDLNDKSLTNRDRNTIKSKKLKGEMEKILTSIRNRESVLLYMRGLHDFPESEEYKVAFTPKNLELWKNVILEEYGEKTVFSSTSEGDIKAAYKGYKVIPCPSKAVRKVLEACGLKSSAMKTKNLSAKNVSIQSDHKITYPISRNYVEKWTVLDAGREILANALDASGQASLITHEKGYCCISDEGSGISRKHFVIGNSSKEDGQIGLFGEGFKMAALVMARENRKMTIETAGYTYTPALEQSEEFGTEVFCINYVENNRKNGTSVKFKATAKEVEKIKSLFICFGDDKPICVTEKIDVYPIKEGAKGTVYVNGLATVTEDMIFSYNIKDRHLVDSRDRNHIDPQKFNMLLTDFYNHISDVSIIDRIMTAWEENLYYKEYSLVLEPEMPIFWTGETEKCYPNSCIASMQSWKSNFVASHAGYRVLNNLPPYILKVLSETIPTADEVAEKFKDKGICFEDRIVYPITEEYLPSWKVEDACTELIANALDTGHFKRADYEDGKIVIEDDGPGLKKENFLIGNTGSSPVGKAIGAFGEGLKLACLIIARVYKEGVKIETKGFTAVATMEEDPAFHAQLLTIRLQENGRASGTTISFKGDRSDLENSRNRFLEFIDHEQVSDGIFLTKDKCVFVNGCRVMNCDSLYSYNQTGNYAKQNLARDRKSFKELSDATRAVWDLICEASEKDVVRKIFLELDGKLLEARASYENAPYMRAKDKSRWKRQAEAIWPNCALGDGWMKNSYFQPRTKESAYFLV